MTAHNQVKDRKSDSIGEQLMSGTRLALVAEDPRLASAIAGHLQKTLGQAALVCKYDTVREHLGPDTDGVLILAAASAGEAKQVLRLVQEVALQKWPPTILVLAGEASARCKELACLEAYVAQELHWPEDASLLAGLVKERLGRGSVFPGTERRSLGRKNEAFEPCFFA